MDAAETAGRTGELANAADDMLSSLDEIEDFYEGIDRAQREVNIDYEDFLRETQGLYSNSDGSLNVLDDVVEGGIQSLNHQATSGVELISTPGRTTTILGRYGSDTRYIIEELDLPKSTDFSGNPGGFNLLNTPDDLFTLLGPDGFWNEYNKPFLDAAISRGDEIIMATPINNSTLYTKSGGLTGYGREYYYLLSKGYEYVDGKMIIEGVK